jgi:hypothetical protein
LWRECFGHDGELGQRRLEILACGPAGPLESTNGLLS